MTVLLLRLAGPMQAWGDSSRFVRRDTRMVPTKSGVLGLLAAADGRRRSEAIEDLLNLKFGVRVDQPGSLQRDFQTAVNWESGDVMPLSDRYYVADAVFLAGVEGEASLIEGLAERVQQPKFPLYLGRRSCPVPWNLFIEVSELPLVKALTDHEWLAADWWRRQQPPLAELELFVDADAAPADRPTETRRDVPLSFDPERREYGWREIAHLDPVEKENSVGRAVPVSAGGYDWFGTVQGA